MLKKLQKTKGQTGFTIIEVLIVLAIAGLIMVVVFLAVPNLQRSQRNNARKSDANNMLQNLSEYVGNANGSLPAAAGCTTLAACKTAGIISYAPQQLTNVSYIATSVAGGAATVPTTAAKDTAILIGGAVCSGTGATATGAGPRDYVIFFGLEGSTTHTCVQGS